MVSTAPVALMEGYSLHVARSSWIIQIGIMLAGRAIDQYSAPEHPSKYDATISGRWRIMAMFSFIDVSTKWYLVME